MRTDIHSHIFEHISKKTNEEALLIIEELSFDRIVMMTTSNMDWSRAHELTQYLQRRTNKIIIPSYGVHPWKIQRNQGSFSIKLIDEIILQAEEYLREDSRAIVGEIGLDRFERILKSDTDGKCPDIALIENFLSPTNIPLQLYIFQRFFEVAAKYKRPVSLHAVKADEIYLDYFSRLLEGNHLLPRSILLHSYSGSKETLGRYIRLFEKTSVNLFVSFSKVIHERLPEDKVKRLFEQAGIGRILLETDLDDPQNIVSDYAWILNVFCQVFALEYSEGELLLENNCKLYLSPPSD